jgi:hypothetical protein
MSYAHDATTEEDYVREPWHHCKDPLKTHLSLRITQRAQFDAQVDGLARKRIKLEMERIKTAKRNFVRQPDKAKLIDDLRGRKEAWVGKVVEDLPEISRELGLRPHALSCPPSNWEEVHWSNLFQWKNQAIELPQPTKKRRRSMFGRPPVTTEEFTLPPTTSDPKERTLEGVDETVHHVMESYYGFKACAMYLKRTMTVP